jgi:hypothetical protein
MVAAGGGVLLGDAMAEEVEFQISVSRTGKFGSYGV